MKREKEGGLIIFGLLFLIALIILVMAAAPFTIIGGGTPNATSLNNYSSTIIVNITGIDLLNASIYYNITGAAPFNISFLVVDIQNTTANASNLSAVVTITGLNDSNTGNFTVVVTNMSNFTGYGNSLQNASAKYYMSNLSLNLTIDKTGPAINRTNITALTAGNNFTGNYLNLTDNQLFFFNISAHDKTLNFKGTSTQGVSDVFINVTNSSGGQNATYTANQSGSTWFPELGGINITDFSDGVYNFTVWANDSLNNINKTTFVEFRIDRVAPTVTLTLDNTATISSKIVFNVTVAGAESGVVGACSADTSGLSVSGTGTAAQTLSDSSLSCGQSKKYIVTCTSQSGRTGQATATYTSDTCGGGSSSGGGSSGSAAAAGWTNTFTTSNEQISTGYTKSLSAKERVKVLVGTQTHYVGVKSISGNTVSIQITSDPIDTTISVGEEKNFDVDGDGTADLYVKVNSVDNGVASLTIKKAVAGASVDQSAGSSSGTDSQTPGAETGSTSINKTGWIIGIVVALVIIAAGVGLARRKK
ncbi:MAG: hypothetical protein Q7S56_02100 [Nanoarchaeota archaeon]|nr:hypothetical protein [Nanoarchaeota archaeon]